ncbi:vitelline envelope sperm lysin receptor-like [Haliotis rubra]|uniref:vitelline envelope sperm lysin receptor-like n=1 Tax=Haliotis rubra TaxID=36100 RepID=UPI001EE62F57|nr:vitelline envelope sperm lysin receptor-like [Haliotis rubra]XP_046555331.1 vitelline envelope sperm lysin receptor-like [Haliotis rubra]
MVVADALLTFLCASTVWAAIPKGYILKAKPACGPDGVSDATITVTSDLEVKAKAKCAGGLVDFQYLDFANLQLSVSYPGRGSSKCVFKQRPGAKVYSVDVVMSYGEPNNVVHQSTEEVTFTCTFDSKGKSKSPSQKVAESLIAPTVLQQNKGVEATKSTFAIFLTDLVGRPVRDPVSLGRVVQLYATSNGGMNEPGFHPTSCDVLGSKPGTRYSILRGGCGDGIVFPKNTGFYTFGLEAISPYFKALSIAGSTNVKFECNFTVCTQPCDGSSCDSTRRRRDAQEDVATGAGQIGMMETKLYQVDTRRKRTLSGRSRPRKSRRLSKLWV